MRGVWPLRPQVGTQGVVGLHDGLFHYEQARALVVAERLGFRHAANQEGRAHQIGEGVQGVYLTGGVAVLLSVSIASPFRAGYRSWRRGKLGENESGCRRL